MPSFDEKERERGALPCSETRQQSGVKERFARGWKSSTRFFPVFYFISPFLSFFLFFYFYLPSGVADRHRPLFLTHPVLRAYRVLASNHPLPSLLSPIPVPQRGGSPWDVIYSCFQRSFKRTFPFSLVKMYQPRFPSRHFFSLSLSFSLPLPEIPLSLSLSSSTLQQSFCDNRSYLRKKKKKKLSKGEEDSPFFKLASTLRSVISRYSFLSRKEFFLSFRRKK